MADKTKRPRRYMMRCAEKLVEMIAPACDRIEIAGSIRRAQPMIGDIEIVAIPTPERDLFGEIDQKRYAERLNNLMRDWPIEYVHNGDRNKRFLFTDKQLGPTQPLTADLFLCTPDQWGYIFMLRTGSADFSRRMVTPKLHGGFKPDTLTVENGYVKRDGNIIAVPEEKELFDLWQMKFIPPRSRR